jgi:DNA-binding transcriptional ArsR family regulator
VADLDLTLAALADPGRRAIIELLHEKPQRPSDVAEALEMTRPAMSRHLRILRTAGLVEQETPEDDARARTISLRREPFSQLREWVEEVEAFWTEELAAFKAYAEQQHAERKQAEKKKGKRR